MTVQLQQMPPTSGFHYYCVQLFHVTRHYLDRHQPIGEPVTALNVPDERSSGESTEVSAVTN